MNVFKAIAAFFTYLLAMMPLPEVRKRRAREKIEKRDKKGLASLGKEPAYPT